MRPKSSLFRGWFPDSEPRGFKYRIFKASGPNNPLRVWCLEPWSLSIGYLDALGNMGLQTPGSRVLKWEDSWSKSELLQIPRSLTQRPRMVPCELPSILWIVGAY